MRRLALIVCLVIGAVLVTRSLLAAQDFVIIPEPSPLGLGEYEPDIAAMTAHYTELFRGRTHREIVAMLEDGGVNYSFPEPDLIRFWVSKSLLPLPAAYAMRVRIRVEEGRFAGVHDIGAGGLNIP